MANNYEPLMSFIDKAPYVFWIALRKNRYPESMPLSALCSSIEASAPEDYRLIYSPELTGFYADPFIVSRDGLHHLFFEDYDWRSRKGVISRITLDADLNMSPPVRLIDKPYHLSYPFLFEDGGVLYMVPEQHQARKIDLYECVDFPDKWVFRKTLMDDTAAVDTTLLFLHGKYWLFTSPTSGSLRLFYSDDLFGEWIPHPVNAERRYGSDHGYGRGGGAVFRRSGSLYRPIQGNFERYGESLIINEIIALDEENFLEQECCRINHRNVHHFSMNDSLVVIDSNSYQCTPFFDPPSGRQGGG